MLSLFAVLAGGVPGIFWSTVAPVRLDVAELKELPCILSIVFMLVVAPTTCKLSLSFSVVVTPLAPARRGTR